MIRCIEERVAHRMAELSLQGIKVLVWFGSPRPAGHTAQLMEAFLAPLRTEGAEVAVLDAYREKISPCTTCGWCKTQEACTFCDMDHWDALLRESDLLLVATPVYNLSLPSPLKAVLDRCQRYFEARFSLGLRPPVAKKRQAVLLTVSGSDDPAGAEIVEKQLRMAFSVMNTNLTHVVAALSTDQGEGALTAALNQAKNTALAIKCEL